MAFIYFFKVPSLKKRAKQTFKALTWKKNRSTAEIQTKDGLTIIPVLVCMILAMCENLALYRMPRKCTESVMVIGKVSNVCYFNMLYP